MVRSLLRRSLFALPPFAVLLLVLPTPSGAALLTYGFTGTASVLTPFDPNNVLLGQVEPGTTALSGTFRIDSAAVDLDATVRGAFYALPSDANAFVANIGELTFRNDGNRVVVLDDATPSGPDLLDVLSVGASGAFDPVVWPAFGYKLHTEQLFLQVQDSDEGDLTLTDPISPVPSLDSFGPTHFSGQLSVSGCRLLAGATSCGSTNHFEIAMNVDDVFLIPEPATSGLVGVGLGVLAAKRRRALASLALRGDSPVHH